MSSYSILATVRCYDQQQIEQLSSSAQSSCRANAMSEEFSCVHLHWSWSSTSSRCWSMYQQWWSTSRRKQQKILRFKSSHHPQLVLFCKGDLRFLSRQLFRFLVEHAKVVVRFSVQAKVEAEDLEAWVSQHGSLPSKCLVLMRSHLTHRGSPQHKSLKWRILMNELLSCLILKQERVGEVLQLWGTSILGQSKCK